MKKQKIVRHTSDELKDLRKEGVSKTDWNILSDTEVNFDEDSQETDENFWKNASIVYPPKKKSLTIRLDSDVFDWFKSQGKGYQTKINAVLKSYVSAHR